MSVLPTAFATQIQPWLRAVPEEGSSDIGFRPQLFRHRRWRCQYDDPLVLLLLPQTLQAKQALAVEPVAAHRFVRSSGPAEGPKRPTAVVDGPHCLGDWNPPRAKEVEDVPLALLVLEHDGTKTSPDVRVEDLQLDQDCSIDDPEEAHPAVEIAIY